MKLNQVAQLSTVLLILSLMSPTIFAQKATNEKKLRWFEIEVILFQQLGDKSKLKEVFKKTKPLPNYKISTDLLTAHFYPDISNLQQHMSLCGQQESLAYYLQQPEQEQTIFSLKRFEEIALLAQQLTSTQTKETLKTPLPSSAVVTDALLLGSLTTPPSKTLSAQQQALVIEAEQTFDPFPLDIFKLINKKQLCRLTTETTNDYRLEKVSGLIDGIEQLDSRQPYLLSKESLQLNNIVKQLSLSKDFKPLLHLGWREAPKGRNMAQPQRIFAGDNLEADYQQRLAHFQQRKSEKTVSPSTEETEDKAGDSMHQQINHLIQELQQVSPDNEAELLAELNTASSISNENNLTIAKNIMPKPPVQPWYLDGFFKVHLNHYLYITADFSIMNMTLAEKNRLTTPIAEKSLTPIRFEQNRRVISGEIHYFDHPYMGMIVQIRRFTPPEKPTALEALTSDNKRIDESNIKAKQTSSP